jgi:hypothetical protein
MGAALCTELHQLVEQDIQEKRTGGAFTVEEGMWLSSMVSMFPPP